MGTSPDGQPGATGLARREVLAHPLLIQDIENFMGWMSGCLDGSARSFISTLTLRVFFVTAFFSVFEVAMPTKLELLLEKEAQLKAQIQQAKAAERTLEKKRDTRRKILIGAAVLARVERGEWPQQDLNLMMDGFLTRPHERELFELEGDRNDSLVDREENFVKEITGSVGSLTERVTQRTSGKFLEMAEDL
jgi:hypothetical protein